MMPALNYMYLSFYLTLSTIGIALRPALTSKTSGYYLSVGSLRTEKGYLNGKFYLENLQVIFMCEIAADDGRGEVDTHSIGHSFASMGLAPVVTLKNTTWIRTLNFPLESWNSSVGVWQMVATKEDIFTSDSGTEAWIAEVSLDASTELLGVTTSLVDLTEASFVNTKLGDSVSVPLSMSNPTLLKDVTKLQLVPTPCSPDIAVVGLVYNATVPPGILLGVTLKAFESNINSTFWYSVTSQLCQISLLTGLPPQGCVEMTLVDLVLTADPSLLLLTTRGLFIGQLPVDRPLDSSRPSGQDQVSWSQVALPHSIPYGSFHLSHTSVCFNKYNKSSTGQEAYVMMIKSDNDKAVYVSHSPYINWTISPSSSPLSEPRSMVYDHHTDSFVILQEKEGSTTIRSFSADQILETNAGNRSHYPPFTLPATFQPTPGQALCFHPTTHNIFAYGNQVWLSNDGGNHFDQVLRLYNNEAIAGCYVDMHGGGVVFTSNLHKLYFGNAGVKRLIELVVSPPPPLLQSLAVHITHTGSMTSVGITKITKKLWAQQINLTRSIQLSEIVPHSALAVQHVTEAKVILYEVTAEASDGALVTSRTLTPMTAGMQLNQRNVGRATLTDALPEFQVPDYSVIVGRAYVYSQFEAETWQTRPAIKNDIIILPYDGKTVVLYLKVSKGTSGWHCGDVGKTLAMPGASNILILACRNHTHSRGLALLPHMLRDTYPAKRWRLYDLRPYQNEADVIDQTLSINAITSVACLIQEGRFHFAQRHVNMTLEVSTGHAKVTQIVDESCSQLEEVSGSVDGQFHPGEWGLYQTHSDGRDDKVPHLTVTETSCRHYLTPDPNASRYPVRHLDVGDSFKFSVTASIAGKKANDNPLMYFRVANPKLISVRSSYTKDKYGSETITLTVRNHLYGKGSSAVTFHLPEASLACPRTSFTLTFRATCPPTKHLHYVYDPLLSQQDFLRGNPLDKRDKPILIDIPINYRPPSLLGIAIPTSSNIYNADPSQLRPRDIYQISKDTGTYKQCYGKASQAECGCTDAMRLSSLARYTDCRRRAYMLLHPGKLSMKFQILQAEKDPIDLLEPYVITLEEINGRQDYIIEGESNPSLDKMSAELTEAIANTSQLINPSTIRLVLLGTGLYHFRASVIQGFSYCILEDEMQVYVDKAPLPNPTQMIVITVISIVIGGVLFSVYLYYLHLHHQPHIRKIGSQCMDPRELRESMK